MYSSCYITYYLIFNEFFISPFCTQVEQSLDRDNIDYESVSVNLTTLNSGRYRATIIVESNDTKRMGEYCIEQQRYISTSVFVDSTLKKLGLRGVQGILRSPREVMEKDDKQGMTNGQDNANLLPNNTKSHPNNVKMASDTILNNPGILEHIVGFLGKVVGFNHNIMRLCCIY